MILSEDILVIKWTTDKLSSNLVGQEMYISTISVYECQQQNQGRNCNSQIVSWNKIKIKLDEIKSDHMKEINSLDMKISFITSKTKFSILWRTELWSHKIDTIKITWQIFTCCTMNQTFYLFVTWSKHSTSFSKIPGCLLIRILIIPTH